MKIKFLSLFLLIATTVFFAGCSDPVSDAVGEHTTVEVTTKNFDALVNGDTPVLLDFWAPWCGPCVQLTPTLEELASEYGGKIIVGKVNVDEQPELAEQFGIQSIPALFYLKNGEPVADQIGLQSREALVNKIESVIEGD